MGTSIEQARLVKPKATEAVRPLADVVGAGLTMVDGSYAVKINLRAAAPATAALPTTIDGVKILYEIVGTLSRRGAVSR